MPDARTFEWEDIVEPEWLEWYSLTPEERFRQSQGFRARYLELGGTLEPEVDTQSPFWDQDDLTRFAKAIEDARAGAGVAMKAANSQ